MNNILISLIVNYLQSQGQTLDEVIIDFSSKYKPMIAEGSFYTALSRVRNGNSVYLKDFKIEYIKANPHVENELHSMETCRPYVFKKFYNDQDIFESALHPKEIKVGYINTNSLLTAFSSEFLNTNSNIMALDLLVITDTRLTKQTSDEEVINLLSNWTVLDRLDSHDGLKHMGLLVLLSKSSDFQRDHFVVNSKEGYKNYGDKKMVFVQCSKIKISALDFEVGFGYVRETPDNKEVDVIAHGFRKCKVIMGDFNLDPNRLGDLKKLDTLCGPDRERHLNEVTTTNFNQLDHVLVDKSLSKQLFSSSFYNPTTDHRTLVARIPIKAKKFSSQYLENVNFDRTKWTKKSPIFKEPR